MYAASLGRKNQSKPQRLDTLGSVTSSAPQPQGGLQGDFARYPHSSSHTRRRSGELIGVCLSTFFPSPIPALSISNQGGNTARLIEVIISPTPKFLTIIKIHNTRTQALSRGEKLTLHISVKITIRPHLRDCDLPR